MKQGSLLDRIKCCSPLLRSGDIHFTYTDDDDGDGDEKEGTGKNPSGNSNDDGNTDEKDGSYYDPSSLTNNDANGPMARRNNNNGNGNDGTTATGNNRSSLRRLDRGDDYDFDFGYDLHHHLTPTNVAMDNSTNTITRRNPNPNPNPDPKEFKFTNDDPTSTDHHTAATTNSIISTSGCSTGTTSSSSGSSSDEEDRFEPDHHLKSSVPSNLFFLAGSICYLLTSRLDLMDYDATTATATSLETIRGSGPSDDGTITTTAVGRNGLTFDDDDYYYYDDRFYSNYYDLLSFFGASFFVLNAFVDLYWARRFDLELEEEMMRREYYDEEREGHDLQLELEEEGGGLVVGRMEEGGGGQIMQHCENGRHPNREANVSRIQDIIVDGSGGNSMKSVKSPSKAKGVSTNFAVMTPTGSKPIVLPGLQLNLSNADHDDDTNSDERGEYYADEEDERYQKELKWNYASAMAFGIAATMDLAACFLPDGSSVDLSTIASAHVYLFSAICSLRATVVGTGPVDDTVVVVDDDPPVDGTASVVPNPTHDTRTGQSSPSSSVLSTFTRNGEYLFLLGSIIDVVVSYISDPELVDVNGRALARWSYFSSGLWTADAVLYSIADLYVFVVRHFYTRDNFDEGGRSSSSGSRKWCRRRSCCRYPRWCRSSGRTAKGDGVRSEDENRQHFLV